jgi:dolichol-phosphate mannosyltransferase
MNLDPAIQSLKGPILVVGASGFVGANLLMRLLKSRDDAFGSYFSKKPWRLREIPDKNKVFLDNQRPESISELLRQIQPKTIFDCSSFGAYSFEDNVERIHEVNYLGFIRLMEEVVQFPIAAYIHAGSSSEYGTNSNGPAEDSELVPNSHYAVSKAATSHAIAYYGKFRDVPVTNLRLYSVYGPFEDSSRLVPALCKAVLSGSLPKFAESHTTRDFIHVDDVVAAFVAAAVRMGPKVAGHSFNIGTGVAISLGDLAQLAKNIFSIDDIPQFSAEMGRKWDVENWHANLTKTTQVLGWTSQITLQEGLSSTKEWWQAQLERAPDETLTKKGTGRSGKASVSAIIACYKDAPAIPVMYTRLVAIFDRLDMDYEIIFVNDCSPDNSADVIRELSAQNSSVVGINHTRNFGSQAAFRSGMEMATKDACVLLDGDLQDPPELIEKFVEQWRNGADIVFGRRVGREMPPILAACYSAFYKVFSALSEVPIPRDAGDFSLIDRIAVYWILQCDERDAFLRGLRAYVGFTQVGVDYIRPERMFGVSTNNWIKNIGWAKKGIFSFSRTPLHLLTAMGGFASVATFLVAIWSVAVRILEPTSVPKGVTFLALLVMFFGSFSILGIGLLGEYIGKILEETKARPAFIRRSVIVRGREMPAQSTRLNRL